MTHYICRNWDTAEDEYKRCEQVLPLRIAPECVDAEAGEHLAWTSAITKATLVSKSVGLTWILSQGHEEENLEHPERRPAAGENS